MLPLPDARQLRRSRDIALFLAVLVLFRHLAPLLVFFVAFQRSLGAASNALATRFRWPFGRALAVSLAIGLALVAAGAWLGLARLVGAFPALRASVETVVTTIRSSPSFERVMALLGEDGAQGLVERAREHAGVALHWAELTARNLLYVVIGLLLAIVSLVEKHELDEWTAGMAPRGLLRTLLSNMGHVADAISITLRLQILVSCIGALITLPVLLALRLPGIPALVGMQLVTGLVPVVGSAISGLVLMVLAYVTRGPVGLGVFVVSTFLLHKIESYFLAPRLTRQHVNLPGFVLVVSLVLFEHVFGLAGVFLSFPALFVTARIRAAWDEEDAGATTPA